MTTISFEDDYAAMLGYTEDELDRYFAEHMEAHRKVLGMTAEAYRAELRRLYNGYRFWLRKGEKVYNPVSINLTMANRAPEFELYCAETGKALLVALAASEQQAHNNKGDAPASPPEQQAHGCGWFSFVYRGRNTCSASGTTVEFKAEKRTMENQIIINENGSATRLDAQIDGETVWRTQEQTCCLFGCTQPVMARHIADIFQGRRSSTRGLYAKFA